MDINTLKGRSDEAARVNNPPVETSLWVNERRREGINPRTNLPFNDPNLNGRLRLNLVKLLPVIEQAAKDNKPFVELYIDAWFNEPGVGAQGGRKPDITGRAINVVGAAKADAETESHDSPATGTDPAS